MSTSAWPAKNSFVWIDRARFRLGLPRPNCKHSSSLCLSHAFHLDDATFRCLSTMADHPDSAHTRKVSKAPSVTAKSELERLCQLAITIFNIRDFDHQTEAGQELLSHISPRFEANHAYWAREKLTYKELHEAWKRETVDYPQCHIEILNFFHDIDEERGIAMLHIETEVGGRGDTTVMAVAQLHWRRRSADAPWIWMEFSGLRSGFLNAGFV